MSNCPVLHWTCCRLTRQITEAQDAEGAVPVRLLSLLQGTAARIGMLQGQLQGELHGELQGQSSGGSEDEDEEDM